MAKILVIEDDAAIQLLLEFDLKANHHIISLASDGQSGIDMFNNNEYDVIIVDWMLPKLSGIDVIKKIRMSNQDIILILLTAKDSEMDIVNGLESGADDYLTKPFSSRELNARIKVLLRKKTSITKLISFNKLSIDQASRTVKKDDTKIPLSKLEFDLLVYLLENENIVLSRENINEKIWGHSNEVDLRLIDTHMSSLKKKLELKDNIITKRGVGYLLVK